MTTLFRRENAFSHVADEFNRMYDQFFGPDSLHTVRSKVRSGYPKLDVFETDEHYKVEVAVPGVNPDDLKVEILPFETDDAQYENRKVLRLSGKMDYKFQTPDKAMFHYKELRRSRFVRELLLSQWVVDDPEAVHEHGVLTLTWSKPDEVKKAEPKTIPITKKV